MQAPIEIAQREMYWHIASPYKFLIYPILAVSMAAFAYGVYRHYLMIKAGKPDPSRFGNWTERALKVFWEVPFQTRVLKDVSGGIMHVLIFWSFLALMLTTAVVFIDVDFGLDVYKGPVYLFLTVFADLAGLALLGGLVYAAIRRYLIKPERLDNRWDDAVVLGLLLLAVVTGFVMEGMRIAYAGDPWAAWSPIGWAVSMAMGALSEEAAKRTYQAIWWTHALGCFAFIAVIPYTKFSHLITLPLNTFFGSLEPKGSLPRVDIEALMSDEAAMENFSVGVNTAADLTWKQRLDLDACLRCGRCQDVCPAHQNGHPLSPKQFINNVKDHALPPVTVNLKEVKELLHLPSPAEINGDGAPAEPAEAAEAPTIVEAALPHEAIWECRTCRACSEVCPSNIEHVPLMMELRRGEVMMRGQVPSEGSVALKILERGGNPFGPQDERSNWIKEMKIPVIGPGEECEALLWIGCTTTYDQVKQKVAYNVLTILHEAGINAGVLGDEEFCCGDPARLLGDENLFQTIVKKQIELIQSRKFKYLITQCPHCYNVFKNEYPQFGAAFKVVHHTEIISELIKTDRIQLEKPIERRITYHDPCYLGRYNDVYDQPRQALKAISGIELVEMKKNRDKSNCCGAGGGHYWMDLQTGERLNVARVKEAQATGANALAVGCVFCLQMLNDAVKILNLDDQMQIFDISDLVVESMGGLPEIAYKALLKEMAA